MTFRSDAQRKAVMANMNNPRPGLGRRVKLFSYRHPHAWEAGRRAVKAGVVLGALGFSIHKTSAPIARAVLKGQRMHRFATLEQLQGRSMKHVFAARQKVKAQLITLRKRRHIRQAALGITAGLALPYVSMPLAAERGVKNLLIREREQYPAVTIIHRRRHKIMQTRIL